LDRILCVWFSSRSACLLTSILSADMHIASWNVETGERIRRHEGHEEVINCIDVSKRGEEFLVSGSDDGYIGVWDPRAKQAMDFIETSYPVTAVCLAEAGNELYSGGIDNDIRVWDLRMKKESYVLTGHTDTITSLALSPDSQTLLSNSHDSTVRTWDIRPFAPPDRAVRVFDGAQAGLEKNLIRSCWDGQGGIWCWCICWLIEAQVFASRVNVCGRSIVDQSFSRSTHSISRQRTCQCSEVK
jgi:Prp8 binding protein